MAALRRSLRVSRGKTLGLAKLKRPDSSRSVPAPYCRAKPASLISGNKEKAARAARHPIDGLLPRGFSLVKASGEGTINQSTESKWLVVGPGRRYDRLAALVNRAGDGRSS